VGKPERKKPLGRPRHRWEDNLKMHLRDRMGVVRTRITWIKIGTGEGFL
jgi:hypothetical protein